MDTGCLFCGGNATEVNHAAHCDGRQGWIEANDLDDGVAWLGTVWSGRARLGGARCGLVGYGMVRPGWVRRGAAGRGLLRHGGAQLGRAGLGAVGRGAVKTKGGVIAPPGRYQGEEINMTPATGSVARSEVIAIGPEVTNSGKTAIEYAIPYVASVRIVGVADLIFHRWQCEAVETKSRAAKGSKAKKTDDLESYVYRNEAGDLAIPGEYLRQSVIHAAKFRQDPRSPRKSAMDLFKAGIVPLTPLASTGARAWDFEDKRRVIIQRSAITRIRPAMRAGWSVVIELMVLLPEYIPPDVLHDVLINAGRLVGIADYRPTYGRFVVQQFEITVPE